MILASSSQPKDSPDSGSLRSCLRFVGKPRTNHFRYGYVDRSCLFLSLSRKGWPEPLFMKPRSQTPAGKKVGGTPTVVCCRPKTG